MDGEVIIGTTLDTKQLERELKDAERQLKKFENEAEKLTTKKAKVELDLSEYEKEKQLIQESTDKILQQAQTKEQVNSVLQMENGQLEELNQKYSKQFQELETINKKIKENSTNQGLLNNKISEMNEKLNRAKGFDNIKSSLSGIGNSVQDVTKKIVRWGLTIFGVRTAINAVRTAMSTLTQYDDQLATNIEYIRYLIASTLKPVIEGIVQLAHRLLMYINYIAQAWFGVNLFANATTDAFRNQNKALSGSVKQAKQLQKTLAGFDEMNILQEDGDVGSGGGGGGIGELPTLPSFEDVPIPSWLQWIIDHKDEVIAGLLGIAAALAALNMGATALQALGIGLAVAGIAYTILSLLEYLQDPTWTNFGKIIQGIGVAIIGIGIAIASVPVAVIGAIVLIWGTIVKYWEQIESFLQGGIDWLAGKSDWIHKVFGDNIGAMYDNFVGTLQGILDWAGKTMQGIKANFDEIISFVKNVFTGNWKGAWQNVKNIFSNIWQGMKNTAITVFNAILALGKNIGIGVGNAIAGAFKAVVNGVLSAIENILNKPINTINSLVGVINKVPGINLGRLSTFRLPRLAKGTIVNAPGKGVLTPNGSAIYGEAGREAYLPLDDTRLLEELGSVIGKYITINAQMNNYMNGRLISRELQQIQNDSDFAFNR